MQGCIGDGDWTTLHQSRSAETSEHHLIVRFVHPARYGDEQPFGLRLFPIDTLDGSNVHRTHAFRDTHIMWRSNLAAIGPVYFVTVVFGWIMTCGDHDTC